MSSTIFREHKSTGDRSAIDKKRHKEKIKEALKEGVKNIIAEESIIGQSGTKKVKVPVKGIKEYRFVYGQNTKRVGSAPGKDVSRGQVVSRGKKEGGKGDKPGNKPGEEYYEVEVDISELINYIFDDIELPNLDKRKYKEIIDKKLKRSGYRKNGIRPRLDKKKTLKQAIRRKAMLKKDVDDGEDVETSIRECDLVYRNIKEKKVKISSAVIFFVMDISGSMSPEKKYLARSFFFMLYHFIKHKYDTIEVVFVSHDVGAYEVNEKQFFERGSSGGTVVSAALEKTLDISKKRFDSSLWNTYVFQCSDGDNFGHDTEKANVLAKELKDISQMYGYCEIEPSAERLKWLADSESKLSNAFKHLEDDKFKIVKIFHKNDIWTAFRKLFEKDLNE
jgi:uncharacterized protein